MLWSSILEPAALFYEPGALGGPIKALPALPKIKVNRLWIAVFQARAATSPKAIVINSANLSKTSAVNMPSFPAGFPDGPAFSLLYRMPPTES